MALNQEDREELLNQIKMEIVAELGLMEKVEKVGWSGLSAAESGRVGGLMTQRLRQLR
ncbi:small, acid-soluble spore protein, alpha/beta type [Desulfitibacter alkalitolerans]|uniref:small, acid-soluble spore protein, alpha/beta type n=1 Tax=Desulfitibacter alkalitolerans TaxID=264641 RepID=UPI000A01E07F|nr:small, acid-soluble spore protein, alpha/beta type [Desulfitibacter alkalitolerans]